MAISRTAFAVSFSLFAMGIFGPSTSQCAVESSQSIRSYVEVSRDLREQAPDFDKWTPKDFLKLDLRSADFIWGRMAYKLPYDNLMPKSFPKMFGDQARPMFARALMLAQNDNHNLGTAANATIRGFLTEVYHLTAEQMTALNLTNLIAVTRPDGSQVAVTPGEAVTYLMAQQLSITDSPSKMVSIPSSVMRQIVANNSNIIRQPWTNIAPQVEMADEVAYAVGFAVGKGYSANIGPSFLGTLPPINQVCKALPALEASIFNPVPDVPVKRGLLTGFGRATVGNCGDTIAY